jgi:phospholipid/cholesterol/gamma-HCH transport system substrate-binding protein
LDEEDYTPVVTLEIYTEYDKFSEATSVAILTAGLLGEQYLGIQPGFIDESIDMLQPGDFIEDTKPALVLEELIGQFLFSQGSGEE